MTSSTPEDLITRYRHGLLAMALRLLHNREDAEDCLQNASLKIWLHWNSRMEPERSAAWARAIVRNECRDFLRRQDSRRQDLHCSLEEGSPAVPSGENGIIARLVLVKALSELPSHQREAFILWAGGEMPTGNSTVKVRAVRARQTIRIRFS